MFDSLIAPFAPFIAEGLATLLTLIFGWVAVAVRRYFGLQAEAIMRDALHRAIETGLKQAPLLKMSEEDAVNVAVDYARRSVPDAIIGLRATQTVLKQIAMSKVGDHLQIVF